MSQGPSPSDIVVPMSLMLIDGAAGGGWRWHCVGPDYAVVSKRAANSTVSTWQLGRCRRSGLRRVGAFRALCRPQCRIQERARTRARV
jgi:hypothetical protein